MSLFNNSNREIYEDSLKTEILKLRTAICIHVREDGVYLGAGILDNDIAAVKEFVNFWNEDD